MNCTHPSGAAVQPLRGMTPRLTEGKKTQKKARCVRATQRSSKKWLEPKWLRIHDGSGQPDSVNCQEEADSETFVMGNDEAEFVNKMKDQK